MHHGAEFTAVLFVCVALGLGALTRYCARWVRLPYTVVVLLIGIAAGAALSSPTVLEAAGVLARLRAGASLAPDLIIFVFLPALVFESAFDTDAHAFRKDLGAILMFAMPVLLISTALVGAWALLVSGLAWQWSWLAALVFGALISATDPVAVVAILRESSAPKRISILIEGESLLNDGTAIVLFGALMGLLLSPTGDPAIGAELLSFSWVVGGGVLVGLGTAWLISCLIARTFDDALIEISLTVVAAYGAMFLAEGLLHVSGVMAVVTAGLWMSGPGRTRISPEVQRFLHQFWSMVAFVANTLIFFLVGLVIAAQHESARPVDYLVVVLVFTGVVVIRFGLVFAFRPIVALVGPGVDRREATVISWGGLRGAVSLALALMVSQHQALPESLRQQILLVTAGVVLLTVLVNGSSVGWLLRRLGLTRRPLAEAVASLGVESDVLTEVEERLGKMALRQDLRMVPWAQVTSQLTQRLQAVEGERRKGQEQVEAAPEAEQLSMCWGQAIRIERCAYWQAFADGTLSAECTRFLDHEIKLQLDALALGNTTPPSTRMMPADGWRDRWVRRGPWHQWLINLRFERLALNYDLARAQCLAAERVLSRMDRLCGGQHGWDGAVRRAYARLERLGRERLEALRSSLPEVTQAIEERVARRIQLNLELAGYQAQIDSGALDVATAEQSIAEIKRGMKELLSAPRRLRIPETADIVCSMPLFANLDETALRDLASITKEEVFEAGMDLMRQGDESDGMYIIARGAVHVLRESRGIESRLGTLGGGEVIGEMALLTGERRNATVRAATTVTAGRVSQEDFARVMAAQPEIRQSIWRAFAAHRFDNLLRRDWRFPQLDHEERLQWITSGKELSELQEGVVIELGDAEYLFLVTGEIELAGSRRESPCLLSVTDGDVHVVRQEARVILLPKRPC